MSGSRTLRAADLFCGAGGFSSGLLAAARALGYRVELVAINHWDVAIATHSTNHPQARHLCASLEGVDPRRTVPGGRLDLMMASPECTHHSNARGGKPMSDQSRATAWHVLRWAEALYIDNLLIENVREFRDWGPLGADGRPLKSKKGQLYQQFLASLRALGYRVEDRMLTAANYGDATTRTRLFIQARRGNRRILWPEPTHISAAGLGLYPEAQPWRPAREVIDWSIPGKSVFGRKKPLSKNTMARILAGLRKFGGLEFVTQVEHAGDDHSGRLFAADGPLPTITGRCSLGVCKPFLVKYYEGSTAASVDEPLPTVTANYEHLGLAEPFLVHLNNHCDGRSLDNPLPTVAAQGGHFGLAEPFLVNLKGQSTVRSIDEPTPTITAHAPHLYLAEPFLLPNEGFYRGNAPRSLEEPVPTVTQRGGGALVQPFIVPFYTEHAGEAPRVHSVDKPLPTVTGDNRFGVAEPFIVGYHGSEQGAHSVDEPLDTVTSRDRFGLAQPVVVVEGRQYLLDIHFRMLQPHELAAAMGFPGDYAFTGNREQRVKQIGNAVPVGLARALCEAVIA